jgi:hypothetical protein
LLFEGQSATQTFFRFLVVLQIWVEPEGQLREPPAFFAGQVDVIVILFDDHPSLPSFLLGDRKFFVVLQHSRHIKPTTVDALFG